MTRGVTERLARLERATDQLASDLRTLRQLSLQDHASALNKIRYLTEKVLHRLCSEHRVSWGEREPTLENMIGPLVAHGVVPRNVALHVRTIQSNASPGSHYQAQPLSVAHVEIATLALIEFLEWALEQSDETPHAETLRATAPPPRDRRIPWVVVSTVGLVVVAGFLFMVWRDEPPRALPAAATLNTGAAAGDASIGRREIPGLVLRRSVDGLPLDEDSGVLRRGETINVAFEAGSGSPRYLVVVDGRGKAAVNDLDALERRGWDGSWDVDDAPSETFLLLVVPQPLVDPAALEAAIDRLQLRPTLPPRSNLVWSNSTWEINTAKSTMRGLRQAAPEAERWPDRLLAALRVHAPGARIEGRTLPVVEPSSERDAAS